MKDHTCRERLIAEKYLESWGLIAAAKKDIRHLLDGGFMSDRRFALLLEVLELAEPQITSRSLRRNLGSGADDLIRSGILTTVAPEAPLPDPRWHDSDDLAFESGWDAPLVGQAVEGAAADVSAYRISFARLLDMLSRALDLVAPRGPTELLADHVWDLGDLSISRSWKAPILFARRLHIASTVEQLRAVLQHRAGRPGGMILTSTVSPLSVAEWPAAHQVVPLVSSYRSARRSVSTYDF